MPWSKLPTADGRGDEPDPARLPELLDAVLAGMGAPRAEAVVVVNESWAVIVGEELVAHAHPIGIEQGCLRVGVDSAAWASHLQWSEAEILARIERLVGPGAVTSIATRIVRR